MATGNIEQAIAAIQNWEEVRFNTEGVDSVLDSGSFFEITLDQKEFWKKITPEFIHVYLGIVNNQLQFFLIDSKSDEGDPKNATIFSVPYLQTINSDHEIPHFDKKDPDGSLSVVRGLERSFRWNLQRLSWIKDNIHYQAPKGEKGKGIFQAFRIPFDDLELIFKNEANQKAIVVFGLHKTQGPELVLWGDTFGAKEIIADVSLPVPPFKLPDNYQLLKAAGCAPA